MHALVRRRGLLSLQTCVCRRLSLQWQPCRLYSSTAPRRPQRIQPLKGIRVLDMTRVLAGPYCTQILGDLGAEIIKIEHPTRGDDTRAWGPPYAPYQDAAQHGPGESAYYISVNRNKRSLALSFSTPQGQSILHALARTSHVLIENYLPNSLRKYNLDYGTLSRINPSLIYASITGYGQTGPYADRAGYDVMVEAEMGLMHITGSRDGPPSKVGVAVTDLTTGLYASSTILAALMQPEAQRGCHLDVSLADCQLATLSNIASSVLVSGKRDSGRWGTAHPSIVPYQGFPTAGAGTILLGGGNDKLFTQLCALLPGLSTLPSDPRFRTNALRVQHREELIQMMEEVTLTRTTSEWLAHLEGSGVPYAAVNDVHDALWSEQSVARGAVGEVRHEGCGRVRVVSPPVKWTRAAAPAAKHTSEPALTSPSTSTSTHQAQATTKQATASALEHHARPNSAVTARPVAQAYNKEQEGEVALEYDLRPPPMLGEHTLPILQELDPEYYSREVVEGLVAEGVISIQPSSSSRRADAAAREQRQ